MDSENNRTMTQAQYAKHRGVSEAAVSKAIKKGRISANNGRIDPAVADIQWARNTRMRATNRQSDDSSESAYYAARAEREDAEAKLAALKLAEKRGELINRSGVEIALETAIRMLRDAAVNAVDRTALDHETRRIARDATRNAIADALKTIPALPILKVPASSNTFAA